jgi:hypothetical protein
VDLINRNKIEIHYEIIPPVFQRETLCIARFSLPLHTSERAVYFNQEEAFPFTERKYIQQVIDIPQGGGNS